MEIRYGLEDAYYDTVHDLSKEPRFNIIHRSKDDFIQYINLKCFIEKGKGFVIQESYPSKIAYYSWSGGLFRGVWKHNRSEDIPEDLGRGDLALRVRNELNGRICRRWTGYLSDIESMPDGISVTVTDQIMPDIKEMTLDDSMFSTREIQRVQYAQITYNVSELYSSQIYGRRSAFLKHEEVFQKLATMTDKDSHSIYVGRKGVRIDTYDYMFEQVLFSDFGLRQLGGKSDCFIFADALMECILRKYGTEFDFSCVEIKVSAYSVIEIGNESALVVIYFYTKRKPKIDEEQLNSW